MYYSSQEEKLSLAIANIEQARRNLQSAEVFLRDYSARVNLSGAGKLTDEQRSDFNHAYNDFEEQCSSLDWQIEKMKEGQGWK